MSPSKVEGGRGRGWVCILLVWISNMVISGFEVELGTMSLLVFYSILRHLLSFYVVLWCGCFKVMSLAEILPKQARASYIAFCQNNFSGTL